MKKVLIISNGHGEDAIAANLAKVLQKNKQVKEIEVLPLVGIGNAFLDIDLIPKFTNPIFPSGGFLRHAKDVWHDIKAGLLTHLYKQRKYIKTISPSVDICIGVGDVFCLWMASYSKAKSIYFLPTAKSDSFMKHSKLETYLIKKIALKSFPRDELTTIAFKKSGLKAEFFGNVMMDDLVTNRQVVTITKDEVLIGIVPGSREEAYLNINYCLGLADHLGKEHKGMHFCLAQSKSLDMKKLKMDSNWKLIESGENNNYFVSQNNIKVLISFDFLAVINQSKLIIGLAGTGNEQAAFLKKPVICFEGFGPQSTLQRFKEQHKLMGDNIILCEKRDLNLIAATIKKNLDKSIESVKNQSISEKIVNDIFC